MKKIGFYPSQVRLKELFSYDKESGDLLYATDIYHKPHLKGTKAGRVDKRDGSYCIQVDGRYYSGRAVISIFLTGALPEPMPHHSQWTQETLKSLVHYDENTGIFTRLQSAGGAKAGARADYVENNGYRYITVGGTRFIASRLAWLYVTGEWPKEKVCVQDGNPKNIAFSNLEMPKWGDLRVQENKSAYDRAHRKSNPMWHRKANLKRDFGMSLEQYQALFVEQGGVCGCCRQPETSERDGKRKWLAVDHCHRTGEFRGLLCASCNRMIGYAKDDVKILRSAGAYLEAHAAKPKSNVISLVGRVVIAKHKGD